MGVTKNTAKAETAKPAKAVVKKVEAAEKPATKTVAKAKEAAPKAAPKAAPAEPQKEVVRLGRKELAAAIRERVIGTGAAISPKVSETVVSAFEDVVATALAEGNEVVLPGFGKFVTSFREARQGHNPQTGAAVEIAAKTVPVFKAGGKLKAAVNGEAEGEGDE